MKPNKKDCILHDPIYMKCPEKANLWRQKVDLQLPETGGRNRD